MTTLRPTPLPSVRPIVETDLQRYQRECRRLLIETESQRQEIVTLRRDLAAALTMCLRGASCLDISAQLLNAPKATPPSEIRRMLHDWHGASLAFQEIHLGTRDELLARIDALKEPIPETET